MKGSGGCEASLRRGARRIVRGGVTTTLDIPVHGRRAGPERPARCARPGARRRRSARTPSSARPRASPPPRAPAEKAAHDPSRSALLPHPHTAAYRAKREHRRLTERSAERHRLARFPQEPSGPVTRTLWASHKTSTSAPIARMRSSHQPVAVLPDGNLDVMSRLDRITSDISICHGQPTIRGLRYTVEMLLELLASGMTIDEVLEDYGDLQRDDLLAALEFGALTSGSRAAWCRSALREAPRRRPAAAAPRSTAHRGGSRCHPHLRAAICKRTADAGICTLADADGRVVVTIAGQGRFLVCPRGTAL